MAHGVTINEVPTGVRPPVRVTAGLPVYVGTAPINLGDVAAVNDPRVVYTLAEFVAVFGTVTASTEWSKWTLHEAAKAHFSVYGVGPIVCINVIDPENVDHVLSVSGESHVLDSDGNTTLQVYGDPTATYGVLRASVVVEFGAYTITEGADYTLAFDDDGYLVVSRVEGGDIPAGATILVDYDYLDPTAIAAADIIGGYTAGAYTGLEVVEQVYPKLRLVPGFLLAPGWSHEPTVAARMAAIASAINGNFRAHALCDLDTDPAEIPTYADAPAWKTDNGYGVIDMTALWPLFKNGDDTYHLSTILACVANLTDSGVGGVPYKSPSNKAITGTAAVLDDGTEVSLTRPQANALNAQGIVTALNGFYGWRLWGNRTGIYPATTDPKDSFIPIRRMFNWIANTVVLTTDRDVDEPGNRRLIDGVIGTVGSFINGLIAQGALVDGRIEFRSDDNPVVDLADGIIRFHVTLTPPSPAESLVFTLEYDPSALAELFG